MYMLLLRYQLEVFQSQAKLNLDIASFKYTILSLQFPLPNSMIWTSYCSLAIATAHSALAILTLLKLAKNCANLFIMLLWYKINLLKHQ